MNMSKEENIVAITFGIDKIEVKDLSIKSPEELYLAKEKDKYGFNINLGMEIDSKAKKIGIDITDSFSLKFNERNIPLGNLSTRMLFHVENLEDFIQNDRLKLPKVFIYNVISISLSTHRGILFSKTSGTSMDDMIFPIIDPSKFNLDPVLIDNKT